MKQPGFILEAALLLSVLGMVLIVLGVIHGPLFYPGLFVLTAALLAAAGAGVFYLVRGNVPAGA